MSKEKKNSDTEKATKKTKTTSKNTTKKQDTTTKKAKKTETKSKDTKKNSKKEKNLDEKITKKEIVVEEMEDDEDLEFDEDLDDFNNDEDMIEEVEIIKPKKKKQENNDEKISNENIKKIQKKAKEKSKAKKKNQSNKIKDFGHYIEEHGLIISAFIAGILITTLVVIIIWPDRIATLKDGTQAVAKVGNKTYTADDLYKQMKEHYSVSQLLDSIDNDLLTKMYPEDDEMNDEVKSTADNYINQYKNYYNYTEEQFLQANGFASYDAFLDYLKLDYRRRKYLDKYVEDNLTDKEIEDYYNKNVYGDIKCEHILVETSSSDDSSDNSDKEKSDKLSDEDAKKLAEEIIDKINDGTSWKDIQKKYKDKVTYEDLGYQSWDSDLEDSFKDALKDMDNKSYSKEPVKTSYGYHVIYRIDQKETPSLKNTKDKIIEKLVSEKKEKDENLQYKALISLRKDKKLEFSDTDMKEKYDNYIKEYK